MANTGEFFGGRFCNNDTEPSTRLLVSIATIVVGMACATVCLRNSSEVDATLICGSSHAHSATCQLAKMNAFWHVA